MKQTDRRYLLLVAGLVFLIFAGGCSYTPMREHPDFANGSRKIESIAILAPEVEHVRIVFAGDNERMPERESAIARMLTSQIKSQLESKHYRVLAADETWPGDKKPEEGPEVARLRSAYHEASKQLYDHPVTTDEATGFRVSVGPVANPVAENLKADALLIARYAGWEKSGGQQAKDLAAGVLLGVLTGVAAVPAREGGALELALIDGTTGDVLWCNAGSTTAQARGFHSVSANAPARLLSALPDRVRVVAESPAKNAVATGPATDSQSAANPPTPSSP